MTDLTPPGRQSLTHTDSSLSPAQSPHNYGAAYPVGVTHQPHLAHPQDAVRFYPSRPPHEAADSSKFPPGDPILARLGGVADSSKSHPTLSSDTSQPPPKLASTTKPPRKRKAESTNNTAAKDDKPKEKKPRKAREPRPLGPDGKPIPRPRKDKTAVVSKNGAAATTKTSSPSNLQTPDGHRSTGVINLTNGHKAAQPPRPATSGQRYDPIRGAIFDSPASLSTPQKPSPQMKPASRSPNVADLLNPDSEGNRPPRTNSKPPAPVVKSVDSGSPADRASSFPADSSNFKPVTIIPVSNLRGAPEVMDIDKVVEPDDNKTSASTGPTPKAKRSTPPLSKLQATGSGLLSSSDLFGGPANSEDRPVDGVSIDFRIVLDPRGGNTINIAQEIIKRYGREALNPRAVAHRERLLQVAAAANKLDQGSGDDMDLDLSDPDNDSNVDGNVSKDDKSNAEAAKSKKRARKIEDYDKEDDFIDDTEMAWEQQASVARDGFFVYSGPLIQAEEQKPEGYVE